MVWRHRTLAPQANHRRIGASFRLQVLASGAEHREVNRFLNRFVAFVLFVVIVYFVTSV